MYCQFFLCRHYLAILLILQSCSFICTRADFPSLSSLDFSLSGIDPPSTSNVGSHPSLSFHRSKFADFVSKFNNDDDDDDGDDDDNKNDDDAMPSAIWSTIESDRQSWPTNPSSSKTTELTSSADQRNKNNKVKSFRPSSSRMAKVTLKPNLTKSTSWKHQVLIRAAKQLSRLRRIPLATAMTSASNAKPSAVERSRQKRKTPRDLEEAGRMFDVPQVGK